jgi:starvation-inducible DNA-binding protein
MDSKSKPDIGIQDAARDAVARILNTLLADEFVLYVKTRRFHWNVTGPQFSELHKFFEAQYEEIDEIIDEVAERARAVDKVAAGSLREYVEGTRLDEQSGHNPAAQDMLAALLADQESIIRNLRLDADTVGQAGDAGTEDFLIGLMAQHEKMAWMLRAYVR